MNNIRYSETRRQLASQGVWNTVVLDYRNPYLVTFWSIAYAGLGHIKLDRYLRGFILMVGEIFLNWSARLNMAIFYTVSGEYAFAKEVINSRALLLYIGIYCFAIFDSYRDCIVINNTYRLADRENARPKSFVMSTASFTILQKTSPFIAMLWSAVIPGAGCFVVQRMNRAFFLMTLWCFSAYFAGIYPAVIYTFAGEFELAKTSLDIHWLLNLPSIWFFSVVETYACILENNKLFRKELSGFLTAEYQQNSFSISDVLKEA